MRNSLIVSLALMPAKSPSLLACTRAVLWLVGTGLACAAPTPALELHPRRAAASDLALTGRLAGVPAGETRFVRWADLRALPTTKLSPKGEFLTGAQELTVVFLNDLWDALPRTAGADTFLATCNDGYASVYRADLMASHRPFLVLEINGYPNDHWPPPGMKTNPGPYAIWVSASIAPAVAQLLDAAHKRPWGVTMIEVASYADRFAGAYNGRWAGLSPRAAAGREIWINSCASCHPGPGDTFGGPKGGLSFALLATHANAQPDFFKSYIRAPKAFRPDAKMDPHPHYTDIHIAAIIAFVTAEPPVGSRPKGSAP